MCRFFAHAGIQRRPDSPGAVVARVARAPGGRPATDSPAHARRRPVAVGTGLPTHGLFSDKNPELEAVLHTATQQGIPHPHARGSLPASRTCARAQSGTSGHTLGEWA